jgi:TPR repeat protein
MVHLAAMYRLGEGVPQDYSEAKRLFILSRTPIGYHSVGHFYWSGEGFPQDYKEARKFYLLGAELGDGPSQSMLGAMHKFGHGVLQNLTLAHMWFNIGAANDVEWAREERDSIAKSMAPEDISNAQAMARKCMKSNYKECGY